MPDWREIARQKLTPLGLDAKRQEEIAAEVAGHLEDLCQDLAGQGKSEEEAIQLALAEVDDWDELRREIQFAANGETIMNYRVKTLWLPGACTIALSGIVLRLLQMPSAPLPRVLWPWHSTELVIYSWWLLSLPVIGAIGGYWSRRAGGRLVERAVAVSLPALGMVGLPLIMFPPTLVYNLIRYHSVPLVPMAVLLLGWGVLPEAALLIGGLPFLRGQSGRVVASRM